MRACNDLTPFEHTGRPWIEPSGPETPVGSADRGFLCPGTTTTEEDDMKRRIYDSVTSITILLSIGLAYASCLNDFGNFV